MNQRLLVHIGLHKTATTYLQNEYFWRLKDVTYFRYNVPHLYSNIGLSPYSGTVLISNEGISGTPWNREQILGNQSDFSWLGSYTTSIQNLKRLHPNAIPIIFLRKHGDLLISMYKQYVQEGGVLTIDRFYGDNGVLRDSDLSYEERIEVLQKYFDRFYILSFEEFKKQGNSYLDEFFNSIGISLEAAQNPEKKRANVSISGKKVDILRKMNRYYNHVPCRAKKGIRLLRLSPRDILQRRLSFWRPVDATGLQTLKEEVNRKYAEDWETIQSWFWNRNLETEAVDSL